MARRARNLYLVMYRLRMIYCLHYNSTHVGDPVLGRVTTVFALLEESTPCPPVQEVIPKPACCVGICPVHKADREESGRGAINALGIVQDMHIK